MHTHPVMSKKLIFFFMVCILFTPVSAQHLSAAGYIGSKSATARYPQLYYEIQIAELNKKTTLDLFYDETVQEYIDLFLGERKRDYMIFRERAKKYFPLLEKYLYAFNIPPELKYMAVLESGLSPTAVSPSQAVGLWQFKERTGSHFGLRIDSYRDDRTDPVLSTIAACRYLNRLYLRFSDWELSLIAYNAGPTTLTRAIEKNGGNPEYTALMPHLSTAAQRYLPALVALIYLFENHEMHFPLADSI